MEMRAAVAVACAALALGAGCKRKQVAEEEPRPLVPIAALAAIPADATVVVGIDVQRLADSRLVARSVDQMLLRDPELSARLERLARDCGVDVTRQVRTVHLALGPKLRGGPAQPSLLVATGELTEPALTRCLQAGVGAGGGDLTVKDAGGRSLYKLTEGRRTLFFAFGKADTVVIGPSEAWVRAAIGGEPKVETSALLGPLLTRVDRAAAVWTVASMDEDLGTSLAKITKGKIGAPPRALHGALDPADGLRAEIAFVMAGEADADALVGFARGELALAALAAQGMGLGTLVAKVETERKGAEAHLRVKLSDAEVKEVLAAIDRGQPTGQDAQPAPDAGVPSPPPPAPDAAGTPTQP